jgi:hypothetical protein
MKNSIDRSHIEACKKRWEEHIEFCSECKTSTKVYQCKTGENLYDEYQQAVSSHVLTNLRRLNDGNL